MASDDPPANTATLPDGLRGLQEVFVHLPGRGRRADYGADMGSTLGAAVYSARIIKAGALLPDLRALLLRWDGADDCAARLCQSHALGHGSQSRVRDVIHSAFIPRFVQSTPPNLWRPLAALERGGAPRDVIVSLHFHLAADAEALLSDFACWLHADRGPGAPVVVEDVLRFLQHAPPERSPASRWSPEVAARVARGTLAALRDYGHLHGTQRKTLARPLVPTFAAAFMALHRRLQGVAAGRMLRDPMWRRFGLAERGVEHLLFDAHAHGWLEYRAAGSATRLEFVAPTLEGLVDVFVEGRARAA